MPTEGAEATANPDCGFCRIISGEAPSTFVHEDEVVVAFLDINPVTPGHLLVVPRAHLPALADVDAATGARMFNIAGLLAASLRRSGLRCDGINLFYADGEAAMQEVFHAHLHVIPRYEGDGFKVSANWGAYPSREELDAIGAQITRSSPAREPKMGSGGRER